MSQHQRCYAFDFSRVHGEYDACFQHVVRSLPFSMSSCGFCQILSGKSEFHGIPWNFNGKQLAGASAILVSNYMEILTFFRGIPTEMVGIPEPPGMIPMGITIIYIVKNSYNIKN